MATTTSWILLFYFFYFLALRPLLYEELNNDLPFCSFLQVSFYEFRRSLIIDLCIVVWNLSRSEIEGKCA